MIKPRCARAKGPMERDCQIRVPGSCRGVRSAAVPSWFAETPYVSAMHPIEMFARKACSSAQLSPFQVQTAPNLRGPLTQLLPSNVAPSQTQLAVHASVVARQAATIVHTRVARVGAISLLGAGLSNLARAGILELAAFLVRAVWAKALSALAGTASTIESSVKKMVTDVEEAVMVPVAAAASVADTVAAVVVEAVVFSFVWACRVLQCLMALVEVHTGISRGATAKCTLRVLVSGVAAL